VKTAGVPASLSECAQISHTTHMARRRARPSLGPNLARRRARIVAFARDGTS